MAQIADIMTRSVAVVQQDDTLQHAAQKMQSLNVGALPVCDGDALVGVVCPLAEQEQQSYEKFAHLDQKIKVAWATPYQAGMAELETAARELAAEGAQLLVLDCMGYTQEHRQAAAKASGLPVVLSRSVVARLTAELT